MVFSTTKKAYILSGLVASMVFIFVVFNNQPYKSDSFYSVRRASEYIYYIFFSTVY